MCGVRLVRVFEGGKTLTLDGKQMTVKIRYLKPASNDSQVRKDDYAPERTVPNDPRSFFAVDAVGRSNSGVAARRVKAIMVSKDRGIPKTYYATGDIDLNGKPTIENTSIFAKGDIKDLVIDSKDPSKNSIQGTDLVYGNWNRPPWNTKERSSSAAGAGSEGKITYKKDGDKSGRLGQIDFDKSSSPKFAAKSPADGPNPSGVISYPFDPSKVNEDLTDFLRQIAIDNGTYRKFDKSGGKR